MEEKKKATEAATEKHTAKIRIFFGGNATIILATLNVPLSPKKAPYRKPEAVKQLEALSFLTF